MSVPSVCVHTHCSAIEARRSDLLVLDRWVVVSHWTWIAGSELGSSTRAAASLQPMPEISAAVLQGQVSEALLPGGSGQEPDVASEPHQGGDFRVSQGSHTGPLQW